MHNVFFINKIEWTISHFGWHMSVTLVSKTIIPLNPNSCIESSGLALRSVFLEAFLVQQKTIRWNIKEEFRWTNLIECHVRYVIHLRHGKLIVRFWLWFSFIFWICSYSMFSFLLICFLNVQLNPFFRN